MHELRHHLDLALESLGAHYRRKLLGQDLDGHLPAEMMVVGAVDHRHSSASNLPVDCKSIGKHDTARSGGGHRLKIEVRQVAAATPYGGSAVRQDENQTPRRKR